MAGRISQNRGSFQSPRKVPIALTGRRLELIIPYKASYLTVHSLKPTVLPRKLCFKPLASAEGYCKSNIRHMISNTGQRSSVHWSILFIDEPEKRWRNVIQVARWAYITVPCHSHSGCVLRPKKIERLCGPRLLGC